MVASLSVQEKKQISLLFGKVKVKPTYLILFDRMKKMEVFSMDSLLGGKIPNVKTATKVAKVLAEKIITSQLHHSTSSNDKLNYIAHAVKYGAWEIVPGILASEMQRAYAEEEFHQLLGLYHLKSELFRLYGMEVDPDVEWELPNEEMLMKIIAQIQELSKDVNRWRVGILYPEGTTSSLIKIIGEKYKRFFGLSRKADHLYREFRVKMAFALNDVDAVYEALSLKLAHQMNAGTLGAPVEALLDLNLMVHFLALTGQWEKARETIQLISRIETDNLSEQTLRLRVEAEARIGLIERSWDLEDTRQSLQWIQENEAQLPPHEFNTLLFQLASSLFANGAWKEAGKVLSQLDNLPARYLDPIACKTLSLMVANHIERENFDMVFYYEDRGFAAAAASGRKLPEMYFRFFKRMALMGPDDDLNELYLKCSEWFLPLVDVYEETRHLWEFDFFYWMEAKLNKMTMKAYRDSMGEESGYVYGGYRHDKHLGSSLESYIYPNWWIRDGEM